MDSHANWALTFVDAAPDFALAEQADLFFLAVPHGTAAPYAVALRKAGKTVVDLSADFRTTDPAIYREFYDQDHPSPALLAEAVYGLPKSIANSLSRPGSSPRRGCFPTSIVLPLVPFLRAGLIEPDSIVVTSLNGVSGRGASWNSGSFWRGERQHVLLRVPKHRHLGEIEQELSLAAGKRITVLSCLISFRSIAHAFDDHRAADPAGDGCRVTRGSPGSVWQGHFVEVLPAPALPEARQWPNSNRIQIAARVDNRTNRLLLFSSWTILAKAMLHKPFRRPIWLRSGETLGLA